MKTVLRKPTEPPKLIWLVDSLDRPAGFPPAVRQKLGFALYQAQIGQAHESAKILRGFADTVGKCARMTRVGRIEPCTWLRLGTRSTSFIRSRRRRNRESRPRFREMELIRQRLQLAHKLAGK